jgi:hypothetical protein
MLYPLNGIQIRVNTQGCYKYRKTLSIYVVIITYDGGNVKSEADNIFWTREFLILYIKRTGVKCAGRNFSFWSEREWYRLYVVNVLLTQLLH